MKTYLLEAWNPDIKFEDNSAIVALTPEVCYQLDKAGIKYSIIEDYYKETELTALEEEYHKSQLAWIEKLNEFLQHNIPEVKKTGLKLGTIYYYYLKKMIFDPLFIHSYTLNKLLTELKPSEIILVSPPPELIPPDFTLKNSGGSHFSKILPVFCARDNIQFSQVIIPGVGRKARESGYTGSGLAARIKSALGKFAIVRKIHSMYRSFRQRPLFLIRKRRGNLKILVLKSGHGMADFINDALGNGHDIYRLSGDSITKHASFYRTRKRLNLKTEYQNKSADLNNTPWDRTANLLADTDFIKWINERCRADVTGIVLPRLKYFITSVCPEILMYFQVFTGFYKNENIDFVITPHEVSPVEFAVIAAARQSIDTRSAVLCHGDGIFANKLWNITDLSHFDITVTSNNELRDYYQEQCKTNSIPTEVYSSPHRLSSVIKIRRLRKNRDGKIRERIIYLPTMLEGENRRLDGASYPDCGYYRFQMSMIEHLSKKKDYTFVWKGLPSSDVNCNPIPDYIRDNKFDNIEIAANPFVEHLAIADRVICDYPSTGFYEAVAAGVPIISIYDEAYKVRKSAIDYFGDMLKKYSSAAEAINYIDEFLNDDPAHYTITFDTGNNSLLQILELAKK